MSGSARAPLPRRASTVTVGTVLVGAAAAATSAVLGSYFGGTGTVVGAVCGSVASTVAAAVYQRSWERTRDVVAARWRPPDRSAAPTEPMPRVTGGGRRWVEAAVPAPHQHWRSAVVVGVIGFLLGLGVVAGLELLTGWPGGSSGFGSGSGSATGGPLEPANGAKPTVATTAPGPVTPDPTSGSGSQLGTRSPEVEETTTSRPSSTTGPPSPSTSAQPPSAATPLPTSAPAGPDP